MINQIYRLKSDAEGTTLLDIEASYNKNNFVLKSYTNVQKMKFDVMLIRQECTPLFFCVGGERAEGTDAAAAPRPGLQLPAAS